jgi:hypothetical protein
MRIEAGYDIAFTCPQEVSIVLMLSVHPSRQKDLLTEQRISFSSDVLARDYLDAFGNVCTRLVAPPGILEIRNRFEILDSGMPDGVVPGAVQHDVRDLPATVKNRGAGRGARCESVRGPVKCGLFCFVARSLSVLYWFMGKSSATVANWSSCNFR